jgi:hypothetical protein
MHLIHLSGALRIADVQQVHLEPGLEPPLGRKVIAKSKIEVPERRGPARGSALHQKIRQSRVAPKAWPELVDR